MQIGYSVKRIALAGGLAIALAGCAGTGGDAYPRPLHNPPEAQQTMFQ